MLNDIKLKEDYIEIHSTYVYNIPYEFLDTHIRKTTEWLKLLIKAKEMVNKQ